MEFCCIKTKYYNLFQFKINNNKKIKEKCNKTKWEPHFLGTFLTPKNPHPLYLALPLLTPFLFPRPKIPVRSGTGSKRKRKIEAAAESRRK